MIVQSVQTLLRLDRDDYRRIVYRNAVDPATMKEYVVTEVYTRRGVIEKLPDVGSKIDQKA